MFIPVWALIVGALIVWGIISQLQQRAACEGCHWFHEDDHCIVCVEYHDNDHEEVEEEHEEEPYFDA